MDRYTITPETQTIIDDFRTTYGVSLSDVVAPDTNLVVDDHLRIDVDWKAVVLGPGQDGSVDCIMIEWGNMVVRNFDMVMYISDRAGPDGEEMPIYDEQELLARSAAAHENPKHAAKQHRRALKEVLRDAIKAMPHKEAKHVREVLRAKGILGKDDGDA